MKRAFPSVLLLSFLLAGMMGWGCRSPSPSAPRAREAAPAAAPSVPEVPADAAHGARSAPSERAKELAQRFPPGRNCSVEALQAAVEPHMGAIERCYREALTPNHTPAGTVRMEIAVGSDGRARSVRVRESDLGAPAVEHCVADVLRGIDYAPAPADRPCTAVYPFVFSAGPRHGR